MARSLNILALEPWLGGSHRAFLEAWRARSHHELSILGLADRHWKWRMRAGAWELARALPEGAAPNLLVASDYLDLPAFLGHAPAAYAALPTLLYFHENQLTYPGAPGRAEHARDHHYGFTNLLSCLRAEGVAFNSAFHKQEFGEAALELLAKLPRPNPRAELEAALERARVIAPGIELEAFPLGAGSTPGAPLRVAFNHRWEHDKDPLAFLRAVRGAIEEGARMELVLLGESYAEAPAGCSEELATLEPHIVHQGFAPTRAEYAALLAGSDMVVSTARHEFFGMSVLEALAAGATPLLPRRLSYPELLPGRAGESAFYEDEAALRSRLRALAENPEVTRAADARAGWRALARRWSAAECATRLDGFAAELVARRE